MRIVISALTLLLVITGLSSAAMALDLTQRKVTVDSKLNVSSATKVANKLIASSRPRGWKRWTSTSALRAGSRRRTSSTRSSSTATATRATRCAFPASPPSPGASKKLPGAYLHDTFLKYMGWLV